MTALPGLTTVTKDPRPVRDRPFQIQMARAIANFLVSSGCPVQLSPKIVGQPPTSQQYWTVVDWLVRQLDPDYPEPRQGGFSVGPNDFISVLKWLRYPFADSIDKKSLSTVGGLHSWPGMLAALHYLVSLCTVCIIDFLVIPSLILLQAHSRYVNDREDPTLQDLDHVPEQVFEDAHHLALAFNYYDCAYGSFLAGQDEFPVEKEALEARYGE